MINNGKHKMTNKKKFNFSAVELFPETSRPKGQKDVLELKVDPIEKVRIAFIGIGMRGIKAVERYTYIEGIEIKIFCDLNVKNIEKAQEIINKKGFPKAEAYNGLEDWKTVCQREDIDLVYICTKWELHTKQAVYAMEQGRHVAVEIPGGQTIEECWELVDTAEKTQRHCIALENCIYETFPMATYKMVENGLLGEIVHVEGGYIHNLRTRNFVEGERTDSGWDLKQIETRDGNIYPTHGFGPLCHVLNIHRGDKLEYLVALSSKQIGITEYTKEKFGNEHKFSKTEYKLGDMNTCLMKTAKGKSIMLQQNVTNPRPYSRLFSVTGTKGYVVQYPEEGIALDPEGEEFLTKEETEKLLKEYEHPIITELGEKSSTIGGHGGIDFIMDYRLIYCLRNGLPLDQDVYDAAEWAAIAELSEISVANDSVPIKIPDFTRGAWKKLSTVKYYL
jgi:predicted dehydrogenase